MCGAALHAVAGVDPPFFLAVWACVDCGANGCGFGGAGAFGGSGWIEAVPAEDGAEESDRAVWGFGQVVGADGFPFADNLVDVGGGPATGGRSG